MTLLYYLGAFALALGILIVVHELGHYSVARWCGVKIVRFSVGFGRPLWLRCFGPDRTEWVVAAFPLGGYVKMLDEREAPVATGELHRAFNRQPVGKRIAIVAAGPAANFLLAVLFYWVLFVHGVEELRPLLGAPAAESQAEKAGFQEQELVRSIDGKAVATWQEVRWELLQQAVARKAVTVEVVNVRNEISFRRLDLSEFNAQDLESDILVRLGLVLYRPQLPAILGKVSPDSVAEHAGLRPGDRITRIEDRDVRSWADLVFVVRASAGKSLKIEYERDGAFGSVELVPAEAQEGGRRIGRIGVAVKEDGRSHPELTAIVRYGPIDSLARAAVQTWDTAVFSLSVLGRMISGEVSWRNLSGPVTIADYAGQSAKLGATHYLKFLALISISLGVLNLLPIPILDGGHLMYYIVEIIKGGPVSERAMEIGQQVGLALLVFLMAFAFYNDINRLVSG